MVRVVGVAFLLPVPRIEGLDTSGGVALCEERLFVGLLSDEVMPFDCSGSLTSKGFKNV